MKELKRVEGCVIRGDTYVMMLDDDDLNNLNSELF
jgi:hypothetical protein